MIARISAANSILLVVDVQEKLLAAMPDSPGLVRDVGYLIDTARLLGVPTIATEQYPHGLGPTHPDLVRRLNSERLTKTAFSCIGAAGLREAIREYARPNIVVAGMETHVCVLQTVLDLHADGFHVFVVADAVQSRFRVDHDVAIRRMERVGATSVTLESTMFELLGDSRHAHFKAVSKMVQERMKLLNSVRNEL